MTSFSQSKSYRYYSLISLVADTVTRIMYCIHIGPSSTVETPKFLMTAWIYTKQKWLGGSCRSDFFTEIDVMFVRTLYFTCYLYLTAGRCSYCHGEAAGGEVARPPGRRAEQEPCDRWGLTQPSSSLFCTMTFCVFGPWCSNNTLKGWLLLLTRCLCFGFQWSHQRKWWRDLWPGTLRKGWVLLCHSPIWSRSSTSTHFCLASVNWLCPRVTDKPKYVISDQTVSTVRPFTKYIWCKHLIETDTSCNRSKWVIQSVWSLMQVAACELLHSLVVYMVGKSAQMVEGKNSLPPMYKLHKRLFPVLLRLACDVDQVRTFIDIYFSSHKSEHVLQCHWPLFLILKVIFVMTRTSDLTIFNFDAVLVLLYVYLYRNWSNC